MFEVQASTTQPRNAIFGDSNRVSDFGRTVDRWHGQLTCDKLCQWVMEIMYTYLDLKPSLQGIM